MTPQSQDQPLTLAGQTYQLRFSVKAMLALKDRWGLKDDRQIEARMKSASVEDFVTIVWAGLRTHHPELSEEQVLGWLDDGGLDGMKAAMDSAIVAAKPKPRPPGKRP